MSLYVLLSNFGRNTTFSPVSSAYSHWPPPFPRSAIRTVHYIPRSPQDGLQSVLSVSIVSISLLSIAHPLIPPQYTADLLCHRTRSQDTGHHQSHFVLAAQSVRPFLHLHLPSTHRIWYRILTQSDYQYLSRSIGRIHDHNVFTNHHLVRCGADEQFQWE